MVAGCISRHNIKAWECCPDWNGLLVCCQGRGLVRETLSPRPSGALQQPLHSCFCSRFLLSGPCSRLPESDSLRLEPGYEYLAQRNPTGLRVEKQECTQIPHCAHGKPKSDKADPQSRSQWQSQTRI